MPRWYPAVRSPLGSRLGPTARTAGLAGSGVDHTAAPEGPGAAPKPSAALEYITRTRHRAIEHKWGHPGDRVLPVVLYTTAGVLNTQGPAIR